MFEIRKAYAWLNRVIDTLSPRYLDRIEWGQFYCSSFIVMPFPVIPAFDKATDKSFHADDLAVMDEDVLALCKFYKLSGVTVNNLAADEFVSVQSFLNVVDDEHRVTLLACARGGANKIGLKRILQRVVAGDLRVELPDAGEPPKKKKKKSATASAAAVASTSAVGDDDNDDDDDVDADEAVGFERSKVSLSLSLSLSLSPSLPLSLSLSPLFVDLWAPWEGFSGDSG
jgi:hypothetical protein